MKKILVLFLSFISIANAESLKLKIPILEDFPSQHIFYHDLLRTSLKESGHKVELITSHLPHLRIKYYMDIGDVSIFWMIESEARNRKYIPIKVGLTNRLIGKRILFIKDGTQKKYKNIKTLKDFRNLNQIGCLGKKWFDVEVWRSNNLKYREYSGNWKSIYGLISKKENNYFPRGMNEILLESKSYPELAIEKNLVLIYDRDFIFYLSRNDKKAGYRYKKIIEDSLKRSQKSGLIKRLVRKYWEKNYKILNYDKRVKISLKTPR